MKLATPSMLAALVLVAGGAGLAHAQQAKHDSNAPIDWDADRMEVHDKDHRAILIGNVKAVQQDMTLTADRATANYTGSVANSGGTGAGGGNPQVHRLDANGHVVVTRPNEVAHGEYGIYDLDKRLVTLIGNVTLDRTGPNAGTVRGGRLVINLNTNQANMDGSAVGGNGTAGTGGRVSGRFTVPQHDNDKNSSGTPAAKPATAPKPAQS
ncbi:LptA/OstA family protein [Sphingomonas oligoaromativorans]|uniref:LptA/OstA family protein n=1 Tax=Sphingomonas oligoaromativorans TaxID=575322 RepID=UPI001423F042|nr:LptA/OstA family protein [Sphingomonas oligoaromativorans]NIJ33012.1 lipopolysaccharide export system protein LptA [Sphingomonas oligoaromativorans]